MHPSGNNVASSLRSSTSTPRRVIVNVLAECDLTDLDGETAEKWLEDAFKAIAVRRTLAVGDPLFPSIENVAQLLICDAD